MPDLGKEELDKLFCMYGKKYKLQKLLIKAVAVTESSLNQTAYRYEPAFWEKYLKPDPFWKTQDPAIVSASYGLMQLMWTTAYAMGFRGTQEDLYNPVNNIELGSRLLRQILDKVYTTQACGSWRITPIGTTLARYNGGAWKNPDEKGNLRNFTYTAKVFRAWDDLNTKEKECEDAP